MSEAVKWSMDYGFTYNVTDVTRHTLPLAEGFLCLNAKQALMVEKVLKDAALPSSPASPGPDKTTA